MKPLITILLIACFAYLNAQYYSTQLRYDEISEIDILIHDKQVSEKIVRYSKFYRKPLTFQHYKYNDTGELIYYAEKFKGQKPTTTTLNYINGKLIETHTSDTSRCIIDGKRDKQWLVTNTIYQYRYDTSTDTIFWYQDLFNYTVFKPNYIPIGVIVLKRDSTGRLIQLSEIDTLHNSINKFTWQYDSSGRKTLSIAENNINDLYWSCVENESIYYNDSKQVVHVSKVSSANELLSMATTCLLNKKGQIVCCKRKGFISRIYYYKNGLQKSAVSWNKGKITTARYSYKYRTKPKI